MKEQIESEVQAINDAVWELNKKGFSIRMPESIRFTVDVSEESGNSQSNRSETGKTTRVEAQGVEEETSKIGARKSTRENGERSVSTGPGSIGTPDKETMEENLEYGGD